MRTSILVFIICIATSLLFSCKKDMLETPSDFQKLETTKYFDAEVLSQNNFKIYGKWKIFEISGGFSGHGYDLNFDFIEFKEYGIYGFVRNDSLLEYGKIMPGLQTPNDLRLLVKLEKDKNSNSFLSDRDKYVEFSGTDTLHLISPCCDRYNYHFKRIR